MLLILDIGNTDTVAALYAGKKLHRTRRFPSNRNPRERSSLVTSFRTWLQEEGIAPAAITGVAITSVVPSLSSLYERVLAQMVRCEPLVVTGALPLGIKIQYDDPRTLGADRVCNVVAGFEKYGGPSLVIDFGTATTYDLIGKNGDFLGGVIAAGVGTMASGLHRETAQLPEVPLKFPRTPVGRSTVASLQSGILYGAVDAAEGMIARLKNTTGRKMTVIATGGLAPIIARKCPRIEHVEPHLVLEGAKLIYERMKQRKLR